MDAPAPSRSFGELPTQREGERQRRMSMENAWLAACHGLRLTGMSKWSESMRRRAHSGANLGALRRTMKHPLRRVIGEETIKGVVKERLECGHFQLPRRDMIGQTNALRRRCRQCGWAANVRSSSNTAS